MSVLVVAPLALLCVWLGSVAWFVLLLVAAALLAMEWVALCRESVFRKHGSWFLGIVLGAIGAGILLPIGFGCVVLAGGAALIWARTQYPAFGLGVLYIGLASLALLWLRGSGDVGRVDVFFVLLIVSASDIGAYAVGRFFGGPKLAPSISPGKTWSGAFGGLIAALFVGLGYEFLVTEMVSGQTYGATVFLGISAQCGDLLESWIKRRFGVKDSGSLLPGHGGLLDRLDGLLIATPAAVLWNLSMQSGIYLWQ